MRICAKCTVEKLEAEFYAKPSGRLYLFCKPCHNDRSRDWAKANPEKTRAIKLAGYARNRGAEIARSRAYAEAHREQVAERNREWRVANPEKAREHARQSYCRNREQRVLASSAWKKQNPAKVAVINKRREAAKLRATPVWANHFFIEEAYDLAIRRTKATGSSWHVDHLVPLRSSRVCGLHVEANLAVIPAKANLAKGNRMWPGMPS